MQKRKRRRSDRAGRPAMRSPGRPPATGRAEQQRFSIARGLSSEDAAVSCGVSPPVGGRWFREGGGMPPISFAPIGSTCPWRSGKRSRSCERRHCPSAPESPVDCFARATSQRGDSDVSGVDCAVAQRPTCQAPEDSQLAANDPAEELRAGPSEDGTPLLGPHVGSWSGRRLAAARTDTADRPSAPDSVSRR